MNSQQKPTQKTQDDRYSNLNPKPRPEDPKADPIRSPKSAEEKPAAPENDPGMIPPNHDEPSYPGYPGRPEEFPPQTTPPNEIPERKNL